MSKRRRRSIVLHILPVSTYLSLSRLFIENGLLSRARRNRQGHLEPDAPEDVVQQSLGFDKYEHGPKREAEGTNKPVENK